MELFVHDDQWQAWEQALAQDPGDARLALQLAWHLRQRDSRRCLALCAEWMPRLGPGVGQARLALAHAEATALLAAQAPPPDEAAAALSVFELAGDAQGQADALYLLSWLAWLRGAVTAQDSYLQRSIAAARQAGDVARIEVAEATLAFSEALRDPALARRRWTRRFEQGEPHPAAAAWVMEVRGTLAAELDSDYGRAAGLRIHAFQQALSMGQLRSAIMAALNLVDGLNMLNDPEAALPWAERALELARGCGWPTTLARALLVQGETLRHLQRLQAAEAMMREGLDLLTELHGSRIHAIGLRYHGHLQLDAGQPSEALRSFEQLGEIAERLQQSDLRFNAQRGRALALSALGRAAEAAVAAAEALASAEAGQHAARQAEALIALAELHLLHLLPPPEGLSAGSSAALHYLNRARALGEDIVGYKQTPALLRALADAHQAQGELPEAYRWLVQANLAQRRLQREEASQQALASAVMRETESARAEAQRERQLAEAQQRHAALEQRQVEQLQTLLALGEALTAELELPGLLRLLGARLQAWLGSQAAQLLVPAEGGAWRPLLDETPELVLDTELLAHCSAHAAAAAPTYLPARACLLGPLQSQGRLRGLLLMRLQEPPDRASEHLFGSLCAFLAIALDNAASYSALREAQSRLLAQQKHAQLGQLVAGIAAELHGPIQQALQMGDALQQTQSELEQRWEQGQLRQSTLEQALGLQETQAQGLLDTLGQATLLVQRFKALAEEQGSAPA